MKNCTNCKHAGSDIICPLCIDMSSWEPPEYDITWTDVIMSEQITHEEVFETDKIQIGGDHYKKSIQPWDFIIANDLGFLEGNIIKYITRWKDKGGVEDLQKARHYIDKLIEVNKRED